jgi:hypothetical protein
MQLEQKCAPLTVTLWAQPTVHSKVCLLAKPMDGLSAGRTEMLMEKQLGLEKDPVLGFAKGFALALGMALLSERSMD